MKIYSPREVDELLKDSHFADIRLLDKNGKTCVPWKSKLASLEVRHNAIKKHLKSATIPDGIYILNYGSRMDYYTLKILKNVSGNYKVSEEEETEEVKTPPTMEKENVKQDVLTNADIVNLQVDLRSLQLENEILKGQIEDLENEVDDLEKTAEENTTLKDSEENNPLKNFSWLKDVIPSLADAYFDVEREKLKIRQAEIGLQYQQNAPPPPVKKEVEYPEASKESILKFKAENPNLWGTFYEQNKSEIDEILTNE